MDHLWRVEIEARSIDLDFYKSIGTEVSVLHQVRTDSMWGSRSETDWDPAHAGLIHIQNIYRGSGPEYCVADREWHDVAQAELCEWAVGHPIYFPASHISSRPVDLPLEIHEVQSLVEVVIGDEVLTGRVSTALPANHLAAA
jgi:hypothetical protein